LSAFAVRRIEVRPLALSFAPALCTESTCAVTHRCLSPFVPRRVASTLKPRRPPELNSRMRAGMPSSSKEDSNYSAAVLLPLSLPRSEMVTWRPPSEAGETPVRRSRGACGSKAHRCRPPRLG
jgi:hypothetical protein